MVETNSERKLEMLNNRTYCLPGVPVRRSGALVPSAGDKNERSVNVGVGECCGMST
jgi:hypothetical protein